MLSLNPKHSAPCFTIAEFCRVFGLKGPFQVMCCYWCSYVYMYICVMVRLISTVITADFVGCNYRVFLVLGMNLNRFVCASAYNRSLCIVAL